MRPLLDERKENCGQRETVENGFPYEGRVITDLKAGVNEKNFTTESMGYDHNGLQSAASVRVLTRLGFSLESMGSHRFSLTPVFRPVTQQEMDISRFNGLRFGSNVLPILTVAAGFT